MSFAARLEVARQEEPGLDEVRRIIRLPVERPLSQEETDAVSRAELTPEAWRSGFRLWRQQAEALLSFQANGGLFAPLRVGGGKAMIAQLCAKHGFSQGREKILHLVPSRLFHKVVLRDVPLARRTIGLQVPVHGMGALERGRRKALARSNWKGVYVYPYSLLSLESTEEELDQINPSLVIGDECHALKGRTSAVGRRFRAMMQRTKAQLVALSGTIARKSLVDYWALILFALGERCPLPRESSVVEIWASALDTIGRVWEEDEALENALSLEPLRLWALEQVRKGAFDPVTVGGPLSPDQQGYRRAFRLRRDSAPGVVASAESDLGVSLVIQNTPVPILYSKDQIKTFEDGLESRITGEEMFVPREVFRGLEPFQKLLALLWAVRERSTTPSGDQIAYGIHKFKWGYELAAGFYNDLVWPTHEDLARQRKISPESAIHLLERAKEHHEIERKHDRELRLFLEGDHVPGLDTPMFVGARCAQGGHGLPAKLYSLWRQVRDADFDGRPERISRVTRVCDYKIRAALKWAKDLGDKGALVWVYNQEIGVWVAEIFREALGDRALHCPSGDRYNRLIQEEATSRKVVIASLTAHGDGKDLEKFQEVFYLQFPRSAVMTQQSLGRVHRPGQEADELTINTCHTVAFDDLCFNATLADALWSHQTDGPQKIIMADYPEIPKLHPPELLLQQGFDLVARSSTEAALRAVLGQQDTKTDVQQT